MMVRRWVHNKGDPMAGDDLAGRRVLKAVLNLQLTAWLTTFLVSGLYAIPLAWVFQVPLWVVVPIWLERKAERGSSVARWLFFVLLAFSACGHATAAISWAQRSESEGRDVAQLTLSVIMAVGYVVGAAVIAFSPSVRRAVATGLR